MTKNSLSLLCISFKTRLMPSYHVESMKATRKNILEKVKTLTNLLNMFTYKSIVESIISYHYDSFKSRILVSWFSFSVLIPVHLYIC